jgi:hypothetical protein
LWALTARFTRAMASSSYLVRTKVSTKPEAQGRRH